MRMWLYIYRAVICVISDSECIRCHNKKKPAGFYMQLVLTNEVMNNK